MSKRYNFRLRFLRSPGNTLNFYTHELELPHVDSAHNIALVAWEKNLSIENAEALVLKGNGFSDLKEADKFGSFYADALARALARMRVGADFGARSAKSMFFDAGLKWVEEMTGVPALNDVHGLMTYESVENQKLQFVSTGAKGTRGVNGGMFLEVFEHALNHPKSLTKRERVALELFNVSFFQPSVDSRFLLLMNGIEALIEQRESSPAGIAHVESLISATKAESTLEENEKEALISNLGNLRRESIMKAGKRLVLEKLGGRNYACKSAEKFFTECYKLRSALVHGQIPFPTHEDVRAVVAELEMMLSDLLALDLLNVGPQR